MLSCAILLIVLKITAHDECLKGAVLGIIVLCEANISSPLRFKSRIASTTCSNFAPTSGSWLGLSVNIFSPIHLSVLVAKQTDCK